MRLAAIYFDKKLFNFDYQKSDEEQMDFAGARISSKSIHKVTSYMHRNVLFEELFLCLALCHTGRAKIDDITDNIKISASNEDDKALLQATFQIGFNINSMRKDNLVRV